MKKVLWVKFGWSDFYRGGPVDGNFGWLNDHRGTEDEGRGHEAWNFRRESDGIYYCYTPPHGRAASVPTNDDTTGWTVYCLAKKPVETGIHIVGWYENATLKQGTIARPADPSAPHETKSSTRTSYALRSDNVHLVPSEFRTFPFSHPSVRRGKYSFLSGPGVETTPNKAEVLDILAKTVRTVRKVTVTDPDPQTAPDLDNNESDPLGGFGTAEDRKIVEEKAVEATKSFLKKRGYKSISREKDNVGFDLEATHSGDGSTLLVEVKGTAGVVARFFLTANEHVSRSLPGWRLAMVTDALRKPAVEIYSLREFEKAFDVVPMIWKGTKRKSD
ncbi:protein NO VEIN domain-containing protein [Rhizobium ruizarguesonis]